MKCPTCQQEVPNQKTYENDSQVRLLVDLRSLRDADHPLWYYAYQEGYEDVAVLVRDGWAALKEYEVYSSRRKQATGERHTGLILTEQGRKYLEKHYQVLRDAGYK